MIDVKFDTSKLEFALTRLALAARMELGPIIKEEGRFVTKTLIQFTPPKNRKQGTTAVGSDMWRLAVPLSSAKLDAKASQGGIYKSLAKLVRRRETQKINQMMRNPRISFFGGRTMVESAEHLASLHRKARNNYGRIKRDQRLMAYAEDHSSLRRQIQDRVGWTASGWIPTARATGAKWKKFSDRFGSKSGSQQSNFGPNPYLIATNKQVKIPGYQRIVDGAIRSRSRTTLKKVDRLLAGKAVNLGFTRVEGAQPIPEAA